MKFDVEKTITIDAPLSKVRELVENFQHWNSWSPWTVLEPDCRVQVEGAPKELGHSLTWEGDIIGVGKNTLSRYGDKRLDYDLEFFKPWKSKASVAFVFEEQGDKTKVRWNMESSMPFFMFFMVKMMKNLVGSDYERGLKMLKAVAETGSVNCETKNCGTVDYEGFSYVGIERTLPIDEMPAAMETDMRKIVDDIVIKGGRRARHWVSIYPKFDMKNMQATYISAISDEDLSDFELGPEYVRGTIKSSQALEIQHDGAYEFIGNAWSMGMMTMRAKKMKGGGHPFEQYWNSPMEVPPEELKTSIYFPTK
jgi:effector-binding domain-containing protein